MRGVFNLPRKSVQCSVSSVQSPVFREMQTAQIGTFGIKDLRMVWRGLFFHVSTEYSKLDTEHSVSRKSPTLISALLPNAPPPMMSTWPISS
jgi:hypothetical protein